MSVPSAPCVSFSRTLAGAMTEPFSKTLSCASSRASGASSSIVTVMVEVAVCSKSSVTVKVKTSWMVSSAPVCPTPGCSSLSTRT